MAMATTASLKLTTRANPCSVRDAEPSSHRDHHGPSSRPGAGITGRSGTPWPESCRAPWPRHASESTARPVPDLPVPPKIGRKEYEEELLRLQVELVRMQLWARSEGRRVVILFEGRDTAGKGGTIARLTEHLNPRFARHVALPVPSDVERGQWYFQRYVDQLPTAGEIVFFDRSWYNRAGVERVMEFASAEQVGRFFRQVVPFEEFLVNDGIHLVKLWLEVSQDEQLRRLDARRTDPLKQWKISPMDEAAVAGGTSTPGRWSRCSC